MTQIDRRDFLRGSVAVAALMCAPAAIAAPTSAANCRVFVDRVEVGQFGSLSEAEGYLVYERSTGRDSRGLT